MTTLIDKLRAAETGSPELTQEVMAEIFGEMPPFWSPSGGCTESVDTALSLLPEYKQLVLNHWKDQWRVDLYDGNNIASKHKSLPIAICIAVLEARK